ncbi:MAG: J domain-containing protein [Candidatus Nitrosomaritimum yanchengensis]
MAHLYVISNEEFEIMIKLGLASKGFQIKNIKKNCQVINDWVFDLYRNEKRGLIPKEKQIRYVVYIDRNPNQYDTSWVINFVQNNGIDLKKVEKIFVMNTHKIPKVALDEDWSHKKKLKFLNQKRCFNFLFRYVKNESMHLLETFFPNENSIWDNKTSDEQKYFCESLGIKFVKYTPLWKYPFSDQARLILNLRTSDGKNQKQEYERQSYFNESNKFEKLKMNYYEILAVGKNATPEDIQKSYRKLALLYHPDKSKTTGTMMMQLREAYEVLYDSDKRKEYDKTMGFASF